VKPVRDEQAYHDDGGILARFMHLLAAFGVEAMLGPAFYLWLAWQDKHLFGAIKYACLVGAFVSTIVHFGLYVPLVRELHDTIFEERRFVVRRYVVVRTWLLVAATFGLVVILLNAGVSNELTVITCLVAVGLGLRGIADSYLADLRVRNMQRVESHIRGLALVSAFIFGFAVLFLSGAPVLLACYQIVWGTVAIVLARSASGVGSEPTVSTSIGIRSLVATARNGLQLAVVGLLTLAFHHTTVFFIEKTCGADGVASYCASLGVIDIVTFVVSAVYLEAVVFPVASARWSARPSATIALFRTTAMWILALTLPCVIALVEGREPLMRTLYPANYGESVWLLAALALTVPGVCLSAVFFNLLAVAGNEGLIMALAAATFVVNLGLNVELVSRWGLTGAAYVAVLTACFRTLLYGIACQWRFQVFRKNDLVVVAVQLVFIGVIMHVGHGINLAKGPLFAALTLVYAGLLYRYGPTELGRPEFITRTVDENECDRIHVLERAGMWERE